MILGVVPLLPKQVKKMEQVYTPHVTPGCVKEGYLFKKSSSKMLQVRRAKLSGRTVIPRASAPC